MTTDIDETSAPHFEDALWEVLAQAHTQRAKRRWRRAPSRGGRRAAVALISSAAAVATLVAALALRHDDAGPDVVGTAAPVQVPADLLARVQASFEEAEQTMLVQGTVATGDGSTRWEFWADEASGAFRVVTLGADGHVVWDTHPTQVPPAGPAVQVDHCAGQWAEVERVDFLGGPAAALAESLAAGHLRADGTEVVDGRELIRLVGDSGIEGLTDNRTIWVDPDTYRPVRESQREGFGSSYEYFERTPEALAEHLTPAIPDGFTQVPAVDGLPSC